MDFSLPPGFDFEEFLHRSPRTRVMKAIDSRSGRRVIVKTPGGPIPDALEVASYRQECLWSNLLQEDSARCLQAGGQVFLIRSDCGGQPLDRLSLESSEVLLLLDQALNLLENLAQHKIVHQEFHPSHLIWSTGGGLRLVGWSAATGRATDQGQLRYRAPEQTGRLRKVADGRTDLYGLGVCLWQSLAGKMPFEEIQDPVEIIHALLARPLPALGPSLPGHLGTVIERLLAKDPDQRYDSPGAVRSALCGQGQSNLTPAFWGREAEWQAVQVALAELVRGGQITLFVSGGLGLGKSTLLTQFAQRLANRQIWVGRGRYPPHIQSDAQMGLLAALNEAVGQLLARPQSELDSWKIRLEQALEPYSELLLALVPNLKCCLGGPRRTGGQLEETSGRLHMAISTLAATLASRFHPLVLFLDDLHCADRDSLRLLQFLLSDPGIDGLLVLATHSPGSSPLSAGRDLRHKILLPLGESEISDWLRHRQIEFSDQQVHQLLRKSQGNPLLLTAIFREMEGCWERLEDIKIEGDGLQFLQAQLSRLPAKTSRLLALAAGFGESFSSTDLADFLQESESELEEHLQAAVEAGVLERPAYRFAHPELQSSAYRSLAADQRAGQHLRWGRLLELRPEVSLVERVEQLRRGISAMDDQRERLRFAQDALEAARQLGCEGAFERAFQILRVARDCSHSAWVSHRRFCLALEYEWARLSLILGHHRQVQLGLAEIRRHSSSLVEEIPAWILNIRLFIAQGLVADAYRVAQEFLGKAGRQSHFHDSRVALSASLAQTLWALRGRSPEALLHLPEATEPLLCAIQEVQTLTATLQARVSPATIPLGILRDVRCVVQDGVTAVGAQCWTGFASLLCHGLGQFPLARRYADLALKQVNRFERPDIWPRVACLAYMMVYPWGTPLSEMREAMEKISRQALAWGDTMVAFFASLVTSVLDLALGLPLPEVERRVLRAQAEMDHHGHRDGAREIANLGEAVASLQRGPLPAGDESLDLESDPLRSATLYVRLKLALVFNQEELAFKLAYRGVKTLSSPVVGPLSLLFWTYAGVALYRAVERGLTPLQRVDTHLKQAERLISKWSAHVPQRSWRRHWIRAARYRCLGASIALTLEAYEQAFEGARAQGHSNDAAMIAEEIAGFLTQRLRAGLAKGYRSQAVALYRQWGAQFKAERLEPEPARNGPPSTLPNLDLHTVFRAHQALAGEIHLPALLRRLVALALENAGGQRGLLLLRENSNWSLVVAAQAGETPELLDEVVDLEQNHPRFPAALLRYTFHTRQLLICDDPFLQAPFAQDPFLQLARPRSVLCLPLEHGANLVGLLYLETPSSFSSERAEVLRTLSSQMAISLQNARHFSQVLAERDLRHEEALQRQALESRKDALAAVLGIASHDLRNPLAVIQMWIRQLGPDPGSERLLQVQRNVEAACHRATSLIDTYLDVAALERGRALELNKTSLWLDRLIENEIEFLLDTLPPPERAQAGLQWELEPIFAWIDQERIRQVVGNLVGNALKYCPSGTPLRVVLATCEQGWTLEVIDQGPGLPEESQHRLFQPFERRSSDIQGSGLGLWICRVVVEAHQGQLGLDSPWNGSGCRFWCRIPLLQPTD